MSNYSVIATWSTKDAMAAANPLKTVSATELGAEFSAIATMSGTKEDTANKNAASGYAGLDGNSIVQGAGLNVTGTTIPSNGVYLPAANTIAISTNGILRLQIGSTGDITLARGIPVCKYVSVSTDNVTNSNVAALDTYLQTGTLAAGTYAFEIYVFNGSGTTAGGLKFAPYTTATITSGKWGAVGLANATQFMLGGQSIQTVVTSTAQWTSAWASGDFAVIKGSVTISTSGILGLTWAQQSSNATATNLGQASYMTVTQLS